jgi:cytochrome c556
MRSKSSMTPWSVCLVAAGTILAVTIAVPSAQRARSDNAAEGMPVATNLILQDPDAYYGKLINVSAGVEEKLSPTAFVIDQRKAAGSSELKAIGKPILVIAPYLNAPLEQKGYLSVRGQLVKFDPAALTRLVPDYRLDFPAEVSAKYQGKPVLVASSIINAAFAEIAKKPLPPPSAVEVSLSTAMKTIGPAFTALRTAADAKANDSPAIVTQNAAKLLPAFTQTEKAWDDLGQSAAAEWARTARDHAVAIEKAAGAGDWDAVKTSYMALNTLCQNCHGSYRERQEDGTFRLKPGAF